MQGKNHVGLALAAPLAAVLAGAPVAIPASLATWCALIVGSLAPDIDGGGTIARPSRFIPDIIPAWIARGLDRIGLRLARVIQALFGHRGGLHWPLWAGLMIWAGGRYELDWLVWFGAGYGLHLLGDWITVAGIPIFGPVSSRKFSLFPMRVGGRVEGLISFCLWVFILWQLAAAGWARAPGVVIQGRALVEHLNYFISAR